MRSHSWISPEIAWTTGSEMFVVIVSCEDRDVVAFISDGVIDVPVRESATVARVTAKSLGETSLSGQLAMAAWQPGMLRLDDRRTLVGSTIRAYFRAAVLLPGEDRLALLISRSGPVKAAFLTADCRKKADELTAAHKQATDEFDAKMSCRRAENEAIYMRPEMQAYKAASDDALATEEAQRPILTPAAILPLLPRGAVFRASPSTSEVERRAAEVICTCGLAPSRGGTYSGILPCRPHPTGAPWGS